MLFRLESSYDFKNFNYSNFKNDTVFQEEFSRVARENVFRFNRFPEIISSIFVLYNNISHTSVI